MWISVEGSLPKDDEIVLIYVKQASCPVWLGYRAGGRWWYVEGLVAYPSHWMPLPAPPQEEDKHAGEQ